MSSVVFTIGTVMLLGGLLFAAGIAECIHTIRAAKGHHKHVLLNALSALIYLCVGGIMLTRPVAGAMSLTLLICIFLLASGIISIAHGFRIRQKKHWGWFIFAGILDLILGVLIGAGWPVTGLWVIGLFVGIEMLIYGIAWIAGSFAYREAEKEMAAKTAAWKT